MIEWMRLSIARGGAMVKVSRWTMVTLAGALVGIGLLVSGCSPTDMKVDVTREEYMGLIYRTYENVEPEKVLAAAERLLRLADEEDITFQHSEDGFRAYRKWLLYAIITARWGTDTWDIKVKPAGDGTKATVQIWTSLEGQALPMAIGAGWGAVPAPGTGSAPTQSPGLYDIFWARMDYLLGLREDWMTCSESDARIISGIVRGSNGQLCSITVEDRVQGSTRVNSRSSLRARSTPSPHHPQGVTGNSPNLTPISCVWKTSVGGFQMSGARSTPSPHHPQGTAGNSPNLTPISCVWKTPVGGFQMSGATGSDRT